MDEVPVLGLILVHFGNNTYLKLFILYCISHCIFCIFYVLTLCLLLPCAVNLCDYQSKVPSFVIFPMNIFFIFEKILWKNINKFDGSHVEVLE